MIGVFQLIVGMACIVSLCYLATIQLSDFSRSNADVKQDFFMLQPLCHCGQLWLMTGSAQSIAR